LTVKEGGLFMTIIRLTDKAKDFIFPCDGKRIKLIGTVEDQEEYLVSYNCRKNKGYEYSITLKDIKAEINGKVGFIKKNITIYYNNHKSKFHSIGKEDIIEFFIRVNINNNELYLERPSQIKIIN